MSAGSPDPLAPSAFRGAALATLVVLLAAVVGAAVRILPWVLDPSIPWATLSPFAKSLLAVACEAALLTGWPVGWALATARLVERGEARALASLGESPARTVGRLGPQAALFVLILGVTSLLLGREAAAPGRVVQALLAEGRAACASAAGSHATHAVPFVAATWLCADDQPRIVGRAPFGGVVFTATDAHVSDDLRRIDLDDARLALVGSGAKAAGAAGIDVRVHVGALTLRGLAPWAQASAIAPALRALVVTASGVAGAVTAVFALLRLRRQRIGAVVAVAIGAAGPLAALASLRAVEVRVPEVSPGAHPPWGWIFALALVPIAAIAAGSLTAVLAALLPVARRAGTK